MNRRTLIKVLTAIVPAAWLPATPAPLARRYFTPKCRDEILPGVQFRIVNSDLGSWNHDWEIVRMACAEYIDGELVYNYWLNKWWARVPGRPEIPETLFVFGFGTRESFARAVKDAVWWRIV